MPGAMSFQAFLGHLSNAVRPGEAKETNADGMIRIGPERGCGLTRVAYLLTGKTFRVGEWTAAADAIGMDEKLARKIIKAFDSSKLWVSDLDCSEVEKMRHEIMIAVKLDTPKVEPIQAPKRFVRFVATAGICIAITLVVML